MIRIVFIAIAAFYLAPCSPAKAQNTPILESGLERTRDYEKPRERRARQREEIREARKDRSKKNRERRDTAREFRETLKERRKERRDR